jgi:hypothetical protein
MVQTFAAYSVTGVPQHHECLMNRLVVEAVACSRRRTITSRFTAQDAGGVLAGYPVSYTNSSRIFVRSIVGAPR